MDVKKPIPVPSTKKQLQITVLDQEYGEIKIGQDYTLLNGIRRTMIRDIPVMAIHQVIIHENTTAMPDRILSSRLGMIPIKSQVIYDNPSLYPTSIECECNDYCPKCTVQFDLEVENKDTEKKLDVCVKSGDLKSNNPQVVPVDLTIDILKIPPYSKLKLVAFASRGIGQTHAKWKAVSDASFNYVPKITIDQQKLLDQPHLKQKLIDICPAKVFGYESTSKKEIGDDTDNKIVKAMKPEDCYFCRQCETKDIEDAVKIPTKPNQFILYIESLGMISVRTIFITALSVLQQKLSILITTDNAKTLPYGGILKVVYKPKKKIGNTGTFVIQHEEHTLGNMIRMELMKDKNVTFSSYRVPHPNEPVMEVAVQTNQSITPQVAFQDAVKRLITILHQLLSSFIALVPNESTTIG